MRNGCTSIDDPDGRYWCSTKIDANGTHIGGKGYWGYCKKGCKIDNSDTNTTSTTMKTANKKLANSVTASTIQRAMKTINNT